MISKILPHRLFMSKLKAASDFNIVWINKYNLIYKFLYKINDFFSETLNHAYSIYAKNLYRRFTPSYTKKIMGMNVIPILLLYKYYM